MLKHFGWLKFAVCYFLGVWILRGKLVIILITCKMQQCNNTSNVWTKHTNGIAFYPCCLWNVYSCNVLLQQWMVLSSNLESRGQSDCITMRYFLKINTNLTLHILFENDDSIFLVAMISKFWPISYFVPLLIKDEFWFFNWFLIS